MTTEQVKEYRFLSTWRGKTLQDQMNLLASLGFVIDWRYTNIKHCCWMSRIKEQADA